MGETCEEGQFTEGGGKEATEIKGVSRQNLFGSIDESTVGSQKQQIIAFIQPAKTNAHWK